MSNAIAATTSNIPASPLQNPLLKQIPPQYRGAAKAAIIASGTAGPLGVLPGPADITAISGIWSTCLVAISCKAGVSLDKDTAVRLCKSALLGMGAYYIGCKTATRFFSYIPGAGIFAGMGVSALTNIIFTYRFVLTVSTIFEENGKNVNIEELVENIKTMFKGNGALHDIRDIVSICVSK